MNLRWPTVILLAALCIIVLMLKSHAHDVWTDGKTVPKWVKDSCCGPEDVHHLRPGQVHRTENFYMVDGYATRIPVAEALPSQDGDYWIFYKEFANGSQSKVYCFFVPMNF